MIWRKVFLEEWMLGRMAALVKWMINRFTPHQTTTFPKWMFFQNFFLQIIIAAKWLVRHICTSPNQQRRPLPSVWFVFYEYNYPLILGSLDWSDFKSPQDLKPGYWSFVIQWWINDDETYYGSTVMFVVTLVQLLTVTCEVFVKL